MANGDNLGIDGFRLPDATSNCQITPSAFSIDIEKLQENLSKNQDYSTSR